MALYFECRTPSDCFFSDFTHWVITLILFLRQIFVNVIQRKHYVKQTLFDLILFLQPAYRRATKLDVRSKADVFLTKLLAHQNVVCIYYYYFCSENNMLKP